MARDYSALIRFLDSRMRTPFAWGPRAHDCVSAAALAVEAMTGRFWLADLGVSWSSERGAARVLRRLGGLEAAVDGVLTAIAPAQALRGDVGLVRAEGVAGASLVIVEGPMVVGPAPVGWERLPRTALIRTWSAT